MTRDRPKASQQRGFSLLEMLVAMAVLSLMMVFLFSIVAQTITGWEIGARRVESAFAARVGLDYMARELQASFAGRAVGRQTEGNFAEITNVAPFLVLGPNANLPGGAASRWRAAPDSQKIFSVAPHTSHTNFPGEVGFFCAQITDTNGYFEMPFDSYFLVMHRVRYSVGGSVAFFFRNQPNNTWVNRGVFNPLIPNCYRLQLAFFTNNDAGVLTPVNGDWTAMDALPAGVIATISVMDAKTAARVRQLGGVNMNDATIRAVLQQGTVQMSRFIPFVTSTN